MCGQEVDKDSFATHKKHLETELQNLTQKRGELVSEITRMSEESTTTLVAGSVREELASLRRIREGYVLEHSQIVSLENQILSDKREEQKKIQDNLGLLEVEVVELEPDFMEKMNHIQGSIRTWEEIWSLESELKDSEATRQTLEAEMAEFNQRTEDLRTYIKITSSTGDIYKEIMTDRKSVV